MAELIAVGKGTKQQWWQSLPTEEIILLGRAPRNGWSVPWDRLISREHANIRLVQGCLEVCQLETARNPIYFEGKPNKKFTIEPDGEFKIGETIFRFEIRKPEPAGKPTVVEHTLAKELFAIPQYQNASECLQVLCKMPRLIGEAKSDAEFASQIVDLLLDSLPGSLAVAVLQFDAERLGESNEPTLLRWNSRAEKVTRFRPSRRLVSRAFEVQQSVIHLWAQGESDNTQFTMADDLDWAFCTPIPTSRHECWCLYVSGKRKFTGIQEVETPEDLMAELQLAELMAHFLGAIRRVRCLEQQQTSMKQFFSPAVVETLVSKEADFALEPREGPISVLFCDIRGFSRKVEESKDDLSGLLARVSDALSAMTHSILKFEGVIADFQGDAVMGFWGWPGQVEEAALLACRAALEIQNAFAQANSDPTHALHGFHVGIGIGNGQAIAGRIGSQDQIKVGVFGPVVNLASRIQNLTKQLGVPILIDGPTAKVACQDLPIEEGSCRRLVQLRPVGISIPVDLHALVPSTSQAAGLTAEELATYGVALEAVIGGDWKKAKQHLHTLPSQDGPTNFLRSALANYDGSSYDRAPQDWDGAFNLANKDGRGL